MKIHIEAIDSNGHQEASDAINLEQVVEVHVHEAPSEGVSTNDESGHDFIADCDIENETENYIPMILIQNTFEFLKL